MILFEHQKIVDKCSEYLIGLGWDLSDKEFFNRRFFPDITLEDDYERTLFAEIKPSDATTGELNKGIGQTLYPLSFNDKYLSLYVFSSNKKDWIDIVIKLFKQVYLDHLFVLTYDNNYTFTQHFGNELKTESIKNRLKKIEEFKTIDIKNEDNIRINNNVRDFIQFPVQTKYPKELVCDYILTMKGCYQRKEIVLRCKNKFNYSEILFIKCLSKLVEEGKIFLVEGQYGYYQI